MALCTKSDNLCYTVPLRSLKLDGNKNLSKKTLNDNVKLIKISERKEVFCGTLQDVEILDSEYNLFVLGKEKFETMTYLRECFYGKNATTGRIQRIYKPS
jgi:hypothetical protein